MPSFSHLHCHSQYSLLDGAASIPGMIAKAADDKMRAVAITDHGNMFGVFKFVNEAKKRNIIPIVGCEFYMVEDRFKKTFTKQKRDKRYHQLLLAKNDIGYKNISKLCSLGYIDGFYSKFPRIDLELLKQYKEGLIATTCCIGAIIPQTILLKGEEEGEKVFKEWHDLFGDDFYIELQRHFIKNIDDSGLDQEDLNQILLKWSKKYDVPVIATNDSHYLEQDDFNAHDILLCVNTGEKQNVPKGHGKGFRFGFPNDEFFFKTQAEMAELFSDIPEAIDNTNLIVDKITPPELKRDVLLPAYKLPEGFVDQDEYLKHISFEGARKRYGEITAEIEERLSFELSVIKKTGYPGYFLIVEDFIRVARDLDVWVGPGRGSAAGSLVAYCISITNVDPLKYDLLFERFLNPDRVSLPDIDIDFEDEGRQKVLDYVVDKYGNDQVAQIITYGSMAARSSIRDVGRVLDYDYGKTDALAKSFPTHLSASLNKVLAKDGIDKGLMEDMNSEQREAAKNFRKIAESESEDAAILNTALRLEGSVRNTGVHACGVIITPEPIINLVPLCTSKEMDLNITQFDNSVVEKAGLLKMDFLGLRTLTILKDALKLIKARHNVDIDLDTIPLDDPDTLALYTRGETIGLFQFESPGMQKHLKDLKPDRFDDLIAMNALYRPGPMQYIPNYVARKHGREKIVYDHPLIEEILKETYGITVYQEQVMRISQLIAGFTKGQADMLRKAMGKKIQSMLDELAPIFNEGCKKNGIEEETIKKIWDDWQAFAKYAFNKSHSTCYAYIAFQTGYLKAHYPAEYMASVLTHNLSDIKKINFYLSEANRMGLVLRGPNINDSIGKFKVNEAGELRFGMTAIKGVGSAVVEAIVKERDENGPFTGIFDVTSRIESTSINKKSLESLVLAGAFDDFNEGHRAEYYMPDPVSGSSICHLALKHGAKVQQSKNSSQGSLFGEADAETITIPKMPDIDRWDDWDKLGREKEVLGFYMSGHPLEKYDLEISSLCNVTLDKIETSTGNLKFAVMVESARHAIAGNGNGYGRMDLADKTGSYHLPLYGEQYLRFKHLFEKGNLLYVEGKLEKDKYRDEKRFKVHKVKLLSETTDFIKNIEISIELKDLDDKALAVLENVKNTYPGDTNIIIKVIDREARYALDMRSTAGSVSAGETVYKALKDIPGVYLKLGTFQN